MIKNSEIDGCYSPDITASCPPLNQTGEKDMKVSEKLKQELVALQELDPETLRRKYCELTGVNAAVFGARFMQSRCAYSIQQHTLGGLTPAELETLAYIANHDPKTNKGLREAPRSAKDKRGVTYRREYHGKVYEMKSLGNGRYEYESKIYTSPTAVVRAITGKSHYNGVVWWGLNRG